MKKMMSKLSAWLLVFAMLFTMLPVGVLAASNPMTVTVTSTDGTPITGATVTATGSRGNSSSALECAEGTNGRYTVYRDNYVYWNSYVTITVSAPGYETKTVSVRGYTTSTTVSLEPSVVEDEWQEFMLFYFLNGNENDPFPASYAAAGNVGNYGPSGDNTPFATINVNITALENNYPDVVLYGENTSEGNTYQFTPVDADSRMEASKAFWEAVLECTDEESLAALEATGLSDWFIGYVAKYDGGEYHIDGILEVTPPVYSIELYKDETNDGGTYSYVGGLLTNNGEEFKTEEDVLTALEGYLGYTITWEEDANGAPVATNGVYTGTYIHDRFIHTITVYQSNLANAQEIEGSEIPYEEKSTYYYVAYYVLKTEAGRQVEFTVTYTDGDAAGTAFYDHSYGLTASGNQNPNVPAFTGAAVREGYTFLGWVLEGGDGTILTDAQVQAMEVTRDMVFDAEWEPIPLTYTGALHVILNGTYDATTHTATGTYVDIEQIMGREVQLYLKNTETAEYFLLTRDAAGIYSAVLENGSYTIHYSLDDGATMLDTDDQHLDINNADRIRYLFFNSVEYDLDGGESAADFPLSYYQTGMDNIHVLNTVPTKDRHRFAGWEDQYGNTYLPSQLLTAEIAQPYVLTAQWTEAVDVYVNIHLHHLAADGVSFNNDNARHDIFFTVDQRAAGETGDYTELYTKTIEWDGVSTFSDPIFNASYAEEADDGNKVYTIYESYAPVLENVDPDSDYTLTTTKSGYGIKEITKTYAENGDLTLQVELIFEPNDFDFNFSVRLDEEAKQLPDSFKPVAANVKVTCWYDTPYDEDYGLTDDNETVNWYTITQQRYTYERIVLDENGEGFGSYPVWISTNDQDNAQPYHFRIEVVSYEMPNGEINPATNVNGGNVTYLSDCGHVEANVEVTGGKNPNEALTDLTGAWYNDGQQGEVEAVISIHTYMVTFVPNGGTLLDTRENTVVEPLFQIPDLEGYMPVRDGGYVFNGWYYADENGNMTDIPAESYTPLHNDVVLIAKWKEPQEITVNVTIATTFQKTNPDGSVTTHSIRDINRPSTVLITLQHVLENGYPESMESVTVPVAYEGDYGYATFTFPQVPQDGHDHRIIMLTPDYTFTYQNEPNSLDEVLSKDYLGSYNDTDYIGIFDGDNVAVINTYGAYTPVTFELEHQVDAQAIGEGFRPDGAEIVILYDDNTGILDPAQWHPLTTMIYDGEVIGQTTLLTDGLGNGTTKVSQTFADGVTVSEYALRLESTMTGEMWTDYDAVSAPFTVSYQVSAYFVAPDGQSQLLVATLTPKSYPITYVLNGGTLSGAYQQFHIWSYDTDISGAVPTRSGYIFDGWYLDEALTQPAGTTVAAAVAEETVLYAKWKLAMDQVNLTVTIDHMQGNDPNSTSGQAAFYDRVLYTQLTSHTDGGEGVTYTPVEGTQKSYNSSVWHTMPDGTAVEVFSVSGIYTGLASDAAYSANAWMYGYELVAEECSVTPNYDEESEIGTVYDVVLYLKFQPELLDMEFTVRMDESVDAALDPASAMVKVTSWYDDELWDWYPITQHQETFVTVDLDDETRSGTGTYSVWQWYNYDQAIPFYYRIEVIGLVLDDGTEIAMTEQTQDVSYTGGIYTATVYADDGAAVPTAQGEDSTELAGIYGSYADEVLQQVGTLEAVITVQEPFKVIFHSNNTAAQEGDVFRTYYAAGAVLPGGGYHLTGDGTVSAFFDIPTYEYETHNGYIFKGWYDSADEDANPISWDTVYTEDTDVYAHWVSVGEVQKEDDGKIYGSDFYSEYDLMGNQIRTAHNDPTNHYGDAAPGLRFITSLSERVYSEIKNLHVNNSEDVEYGYVMAMAKTAEVKATGDDYMLKYNADGINGENNAAAYAYVKNIPCRLVGEPVDDHYAGEQYRLYTAVITYNGLSGDMLTAAQNTYFIARSYIRYFDANGLERIHYNNYTGNSKTYGGVNTCYTVVDGLVNGGIA